MAPDDEWRLSSDDGTRAALEGVPMGALSPIHWLIVLAVIVLLFGASRLANVGKGLGEGIRSFKKGISEDAPDDTDANAGAKPSSTGAARKNSDETRG
jgi:sec-independent protein translocase protein TatA